MVYGWRGHGSEESLVQLRAKHIVILATNSTRDYIFPLFVLCCTYIRFDTWQGTISFRVISILKKTPFDLL